VPWLAIVAMALALRVTPITAGLPYLDYIDEGHVLHQTLRVVHGRTLNTGLYDYPSLPCYTLAALLVLYSPLYERAHGHPLADDFARQPGKPKRSTRTTILFRPGMSSWWGGRWLRCSVSGRSS
jgi:hypothetical protein